MELLLILSALLSALTGAAAGGRVPAVRVHHAAARIAQVSVTPRIAVQRVVHHPVAALPGRTAVAPRIMFGAVFLRAIEPIYMARRRE